MQEDHPTGVGCPMRAGRLVGVGCPMRAGRLALHRGGALVVTRYPPHKDRVRQHQTSPTGPSPPAYSPAVVPPSLPPGWPAGASAAQCSTVELPLGRHAGRGAQRDKDLVIREYITMKARILVVDDDEALAEMIGIVLRNDGFEPVFCADGGQALEIFRSSKPDLVLLDLMLPGSDGIEVCRQIRGESDVPIVMLTAKSDTSDVVRGLESGADDYVPKPFKPAELVARVRARLRPGDQKAPETLRIADVTIDVAGHLVTRGGERISLTPLEFDLLVALARKPWQVFTRELLLEQVWGYRHAADTRLVNVHVQRLRSKIERDPEAPEVVLTVRGVGYKAGS
jgi:DNA-binding response OmpR family regulator